MIIIAAVPRNANKVIAKTRVVKTRVATRFIKGWGDCMLYDNVRDDTYVIYSTQVCLQGCSSPSRSYLLLRVKRQFVGYAVENIHC